MMRLFLCGEGPNELGPWAKPNHTPTEEECRSCPGFIGAVLEILWNRPLSPEDVGGARRWKDIPKLKTGAGPRGDRRNTRALILHARQRGCHSVVFLRDRDKDKARPAAIRQEIERFRKCSDAPKIAGGVPTPNLEAWLLALAGESKSEALGKTRIQKILSKLGVAFKGSAAYVEHVRRCGLDAIAADAHSLRSWLEELRAAVTVVSVPPRESNLE